MAMDELNAPGIDGTVVVFARGISDLTLVGVDEAGERIAADAVARGYRYAGFFSIDDGEPTVECEPGYEATMVAAGVRFAEHIGPRLKAHQIAHEGGGK